MPKRPWRAIVIWIACAIASYAVAQAPERGFLRKPALETLQQSGVGTRWALLVGISTYPEAPGFTISPLIGPTKDVEHLRALLVDPQRGGFPPENVRTLVDARATRNAILRTLKEIASKAKPEDLVVFYFSGHGLPADDTRSSSYLAPYFTEPEDPRAPEYTCISYEELRRALEDDMPANKVVMVLDACHAGGIKREGGKALSQQEIYKRALDVFRDAQGVVMLLSSADTEESLDTPEGGVFTRFLVSGLEGEADENHDFIVTVDELTGYVKREVPEYARRTRGREQNPTLRYGNAPVQGKIPLAIDLRGIEKEEGARLSLRDRRYDAMFEAVRDDPALRDWAMALADRDVTGVSLTNDEAELLRETDRLLGRQTTADAYRRVAGVIYRRIHPSQVAPPLAFRLTVIAAPADATLALAPVDAPNQRVAPESAAQGTVVYRRAPGRYRLTAERDGYRADTREIDLAADASQRVTLAKLMGRLRLDVTPADADVSVTPVAVPAATDAEARSLAVVPDASTQTLPIGTYRVSAEREGYEPASRSPVVIRANQTTSVELRLAHVQAVMPARPEPAPVPSTARIAYPGMPAGTKVFVDGAPVTLPQTVPPGPHEVRLERQGYRPVVLAPTVQAGGMHKLAPVWQWLGGGPSKAAAFFASVAIPGLGQHLEGRHRRGLIYEVSVLISGAAAVGATLYHEQMLDDYEAIRLRIPQEASRQTEMTPDLEDLAAQQTDAYDKARSSRKLAVASQIGVAVLWSINALDRAGGASQRGGSTITLGTRSAGDGVLAALSCDF